MEISYKSKVMIDNRILDCLNLIKGSGSFACNYTDKFIFPDIEISGFGELSYPIPEFQAKALLALAHKAPFGKGHQTIIDTKVRSAWEIDAKDIVFKGDNWQGFIKNALSNIESGLGLEDYEIEAHFYKLLIYQAGDFFLTHKDSEKEKGMFGTLLIALPSKHSGGELLIKFDGEQKSIHFDKDCSEGKIPYAALYADCDHEVKPIEWGHRVVLVYNLIQKSKGDAIKIESLGEYISNLKTILRAEETDLTKPKIILLGHQYTPENFSIDQLKLNDRAKANVLLRAAKEAEYYSCLGLVTSCVTGIPDYDGYHDNENVEDSPMQEVIDDWVSIEKWLEDGNPGLSYLPISEDELLATFNIDEEEPLLKESEGYMGNYGPELIFWYHYGAVILWPKKVHQQLIDSQSILNQLKWLNYYSRSRNSLDKIESDICDRIIDNLKTDQNDKPIEDSSAFNSIVAWYVSENNLQTFESSGFDLLVKYFEHIDVEKWEGLLKIYGSESLNRFFSNFRQSLSKKKLAHLLKVLLHYLGNCLFNELIGNLLTKVPQYFSDLAKNHKSETPLIDSTALKNLLRLESQFSKEEPWVTELSDILFICRSRKYILDTLIPVLLQEPHVSALGKSLLSECSNLLQERVDYKPEVPNDWARSMPTTGRNRMQWKLLENFVISSTESVFDYRVVQAKRDEMINAISQEDVDLDVETIKKGSPHLLRITKNSKSFDRSLKEWKEDSDMLLKVNKKLRNDAEIC